MRPFWFIALLCYLPAFAAPAQTNTLQVELWLPPETNFPAHADIQVGAWVTMGGPRKEGDSVKVEFFANDKSLGKKTSYWHPAQRPVERPGHATPMIIRAAQFDMVQTDWKNVPAGNYSLTARAKFSKSVQAASKPLNISVSP